MTLLAKSPRGVLRLHLVQHLLDTQLAGAKLFQLDSRWLEAFLRFFRVPRAVGNRFLLNLEVAALFHDIGKANEDFQHAITVNGFHQQGVRHEHFSALVMCYPPVLEWLKRSEAIDTDCLVAAVLGHHLKASPDGDVCPVLIPKRGGRIQLHLKNTQIRDALHAVAKVAGLPSIQVSFPTYYDGKYDEWGETVETLRDNAAAFAKQLRRDRERLGLCLALKAGLIAADAAASGLVREQHSICKWIEAVAHREPIPQDGVQTAILEPRIRELGTNFTGYHAFQDGAATLGRRGLLLAACGAGKTMAAWRWADQVVRREPIGRVIFLYPTRGTATEGFRDYVAHAPEGAAALVHGTSEYELSGMQENPTELQPASIRGKTIAASETEARLFALGLWGKTYFSATVDQFLSFMENGYGGLCLLPALADSAVVFDEVHSYDGSMWNALVRFLELFDVPVLCMTATLPPRRQQELQKHLAVYPRAEDRQHLQDLEQNETHARYYLNKVDREMALAAAVQAFSIRNLRVLWVVNTVDRCQRLAHELSHALGTSVIVYHSRFKLKDRQLRHRETVQAFRWPAHGAPVPAIAITTQVCEMSLDLDADMLITELAPISSLIQRFGRANRHLRRREFIAEVLTYSPESAAPYESHDLLGVEAFIGDLNNRPVSQRDLAEGLEKHSPATRLASGSSKFVDGGYYATRGSLRDDDGSSCQAVLDSDVSAYLAAARAERPGYLINVPKRFATMDSRLDEYVRVAPGERYNSNTGFLVGEISD